MEQSGPPYAPAVALLGGTPSKSVDVPITSVFLVLFILGAVCHMTILQVNKRRGKKFLLSGACFGFCMARITACSLRLAWSTHQSNVRVAIAAQILMSAGVILLFIINLLFTLRILRAAHPAFAWSKPFSLIFKAYFISIILMLIALVTCAVQSFYTLDKDIRLIDREVQLTGLIYFAVAAFLPMPLMALRLVLPKLAHVEKFGEGRFRTKIYLVLFSSAILTFGSAFRAGTAFFPRPKNNPAWYHSKTCFYLINLTIEIIVVYTWAIIRIDKRFIVPNGSKGPGDYVEHKDIDEKRQPSFTERINNEEEAFDDDLPEVSTNGDIETNAASSRLPK